MRILAGADFHGSDDVYSWFLHKADELKVDGLVLPGDLLGYADEVDDPVQGQIIYARRLEPLLAECGLPVFYIMGNDDDVELDSTHGNLTPLHGSRVEWGRYNFVGYQYSLPWMGGKFEKPEEEIEEDLKEIETYLDEQTILVTHSPAHGIQDPGFGPHKIGSRSLRSLVDDHQFLAHIHGHSHAGFGHDGKHFNVASALSKRAILIDLETMEHTVLKA